MIIKITLKFYLKFWFFLSFLIMESYNVINFKTCFSLIIPRGKEPTSVEEGSHSQIEKICDQE